MLLRSRLEILDLVEKAEAELTAPDEVVNGDIYIGGGETEAMRMIAEIATGLQRSCPDIRYHLYSGNADDVTERLDKGLLDFGVLIEPANMKKYDYIRLPATDTWGLLMPRDCPLAARPAVIRPQDLWDLPIITSRQSMLSNEFSGWLGEGVRKAENRRHLQPGVQRLPSGGRRHGVTPCVSTSWSIPRKALFRPLEPRMEVHLDIVWKKYQVFSGAAERFLERRCGEAFHGNAGGN